ELTDMFGGGSFDLCDANWDRLLQSLANTIVSSAKPGSVSKCSFNSLKIISARLTQNGVSKDVSGGIILNPSVSGKAAFISFRQGFLESLSVNVNAPYQVELTTQVE
ncbi:MAG: hypothetical protein KGQ59_07895, partial [Bdellovibrionales bacterium]|nr:hypothetical protein [Bdellovibrionales bacterium]